MYVHWLSIGIKGIYKLLNIRIKNIFIERSVCFEEPLQDVELVEEETAEISSRSADDSDDEN